MRSKLKEIAAKPTTAAEDRAALDKLVAASELTAPALTAFARACKLPKDDQAAVAELAAKLSEEHKWLTPRELEDAKITEKDHTHPFMEWVAELDDQKQKFDANPKSAERLTETQRRAIDVGRRLMTYKAYSGDEMRSAGIVRVMPRPFTQTGAGLCGQGHQEGSRDPEPARAGADRVRHAQGRLTPTGTTFPATSVTTRARIPLFDEKFSAWLRDNSVWVPLKVLLKANPEDLVEAGFPEAEVKAFLTAYRDLEVAEDRAPGQVSEASASRHAGRFAEAWRGRELGQVSHRRVDRP